jgi:hypothetical protein
MDMFSKKTQQFVQKVRTKSAKNGDIIPNGSQNNYQQNNSSDEYSQSNTMDIDSIELDQNGLDNSSNNNSHSSFSIYQRNFMSNSKSPVYQKSQSPAYLDENKLQALSKELAASANALNDIGNSSNGFSNQRKFNSNDNLLDEFDNLSSSPVSRSQQQPTDLEIMIVEKAKSDSYMKYLDLQQQQQQLLLTPRQNKTTDSKLLKFNRSSASSSPITSTTTTNSSSCIVSPTNSTSRMQDVFKRSSSPHLTPQKTLFNGSNNNNTIQNIPPNHQKRSLSRQNYCNLSPQQNENDFYVQQQQQQQSQMNTPNKLKPISIFVQSPQNNSVNTLKSASPSPSPKANEIWLEYGCI